MGMESSNDASDVDVESDESQISSETPEDPRPSKFHGPKSTWRQLTEDERLVSTSMTRLRDQDLAIHLYNAHAMKKRHYDNASASKLKPWANKDRWRGNKPGEDDESSPCFVPPKVWTAWPLSSDTVPRTGEQIGADDGADEWTMKREERQFPSRELEDILMAITLKIARDRFGKREWEDSQENEEEKLERKSVELHPESGGIGEVMGGKFSKASPGDSQPTALKFSSDKGNGLQGAFDDINTDRLSDHVIHVIGELLNDPQFLEDAPRKEQAIERPTVSADDERSRRLLRPTIRHTLSKLDELLMALHNARQTCFYYASEHTESQSEVEVLNNAGDDSDTNKTSHLAPENATDKHPTEQPTRRPRPGRPPKVLHMPATSITDTVESLEPDKKDRRGRKRQVHKPLEGESHEEMLIRIARLQKKAIPFTSAPNRSASTSPTKSDRGSPKKRGTSTQTRELRSTRLALRDWSEILGTAALVGFPKNVIDRATQRCAALFDEGMKILTLVENPTSGDEDQIVDYLPGEIPDFDNLEAYDTAGSESGQGPFRGRKHSRTRSDNDMDISMSEAEIRASSGVDGTYYCPHTGCLRHKQGFSKRKYLIKHLRGVHKLDKVGIGEPQAQEDSQEEMEGGVHIDGFMKELKRRPGWRASDGKPRRRGQKAGRVETGKSVEKIDQTEYPSENSTNGQDMSSGSLEKAFESG